MKQKLIIDTNVLIDNPQVLQENKDKQIVLSIITLKELDKLKRNPDISYAVRQAIKSVDEAIKDGFVLVDMTHYESDSPDEKILDSVGNEGVLMTQDTGMKAIARSRGIILSDDYEETYDKDYKGYIEVVLDDEDIFYKTLPHFKEFQIPEFESIIGQQSVLNCYYVLTVESCNSYYLFKRKTDKVIKSIYTEKSFRQTGITHINFLHPEQHVAFDAVMDEDTPLTIIQGKIGSSKTLMSLLGSLAQVKGLAQKRYARYNKIYITRPPTAIERQLELGFNKGTIETKLQQWMQGYKTNLEFLYNISEKDYLENKGEQIYQEYFQPISIESIQGASISNAILCVDEAQLLSQNALKQVMSRVANKSKLILMFDPEQSYNVNRGNEGWKKVIPHVKDNPLISFVNLQNIYRSELTKLVDEMFK